MVGSGVGELVQEMRTETKLNVFNTFTLAHLRLLFVSALAALTSLLVLPAAFASAPAENLPSQSKVETHTEIVAGQNVKPMLGPDSANQLRAIADRYRNIIAQGGFPKVPRGNYKKGSSGKGVVILNQRLYMDGYVRVEATQGDYAQIFTSATEDGVRRFQRNLGLAVTGNVDQITLAHLNVDAESRLRTILANIDRLEVYEKDIGNRYVVVNIPAQQAQTVENGAVYSQHNVIVGRPSRPSPVVMTSLEEINFNPYWNAPVSIVEADIIPKIRSGTRLLEDMNMRVFKGYNGPEINPRSVNWSRAVPDDYHFRQEPGPGNAMATAKVTFKSPFGVYMHDTPEKPLFESKTRFYSSGCIRVQDISGFVNWILNGQDGIGESQISALGETLERLDVKLANPPQLRWTYLTAWPVGNTVAFRYDIYQLDGSGFTVGQPMPVGELSPDGQRFVLKPLPRLAQALNDDSPGFFLFGRKNSGGGSFFGGTSQNNMSKSKASDITKRLMRRLAANSGDVTFNSGDDDTVLVPKKQASADDGDSSSAGKTKTTAKTATKTKKSSDGPGLFDWGKYRKEQAAKKGKKTDDKKKVAKTAKPDDKDKKVAKADDKKKPAAKADDDAKSADKKAVAKADDKKAVTKKPVACKADKDGKLPDGCKAAEATKKKPATTETAAN